MVYIDKQNFNISVDKVDNSFECDDMIADTVSLLNRKGYTTKYSCSGHPSTNFRLVDTYIAFDKDIKLPYIPDYKIDPISFEYVKEHNFNILRLNLLEAKATLGMLMMINYALLEWSRSLPIYDEDTKYASKVFDIFDKIMEGMDDLKWMKK